MRIGLVHLILTSSLTFALAACSGDDGNNNNNSGNNNAGGACTTDDDCPSNQYCQDSSMTCVDGTGNECDVDGDCGDGRSCNTNVTDCGAMRCRNVCEPISCTDHAECGTWVCLEGTCAEPPSCAGMACPEGLLCNDQQVCEPAQACTEDSECTSPQICAGGICQTPFSCTDSIQCPTGLVCQGGTCDDPCTMDTDCGDQTMFTCETTTGICRQRCLQDDQCPSGAICEGFVCIDAECAADSDCTGNMEECQGEENGHGRCVEVFACMNDSECPPNFSCENMQCVELPLCLTDRDCGPNAYCFDRHCQPAEACNNGNCPAGLDCVGDRCVPAVCRGNGDCPNMGEVCVAGECITAPSAATVTDVRILTPGATITTQTYGFTAVALDATGDIVPGVTFQWASSDTGVATIDADGLATPVGAGSTGITAAVDTGSMTVSSSSVALTVATAGMGVTIAVTDQRSGAVVEGATVACEEGAQTTNAQGLAFFDATLPKTCTVFDANHDYVTVVGLDNTFAHISLPPLSRSDRTTGYTGMVDVSFTQSPVKLSFTGGSFSSPLFAFTPANLFGGDVFTFNVPVVGDIAFPAGATASAEFMGFPLDLKGTYYARTQAGLRRSWTFAGGAEIADLGITGGGNLLENILPLFQTFKHGGSTGLDTLVDLPLIVDSGDINGNGDTTEMVPDYNAFVPKNLNPSRDQNLRFVIDGTGVGLPTDTNAVLVVGGAILPTVGFVPLGLDGLADPAQVGRFTTAMAPAYDGLEAGEYAVLVAAVNIVMNELPEVASARLVTASNLPGVIDITDGFMALPAASFDANGRSLMVPAVTGADAWHATFSGPNGSWHVFAPASATTAAIPAAAMGFGDRVTDSGIFVEALDLDANETFNGLFELGVSGDRMDRKVSGFSQQRVR